MQEHENGDHVRQKTTKKLTTEQAINYLVKNLPELVQAEDLDGTKLKMVLRMHRHVSEQSDLAKGLQLESFASFRTGNECQCTTSNFCFFSLEKSFAGKCAQNCCSDEDFSDDTSICACFCYPFCLLPQVVCGWFLPCGYSDSACYTMTPDDLDTKKAKKYQLLGMGRWEKSKKAIYASYPPRAISTFLSETSKPKTQVLSF